MAIIKLGPMVVGIRGTVGGITFSANLSGPNARAWSRGANPQSALQTDQRARLASLPAAWRSLSSAERAAWDTFAALPAQDLINSLGETYSISGFLWYTKINIRLLVAGRAIRVLVPTQSRPSAPSITDIEFPFGDGETAFIAYASGTFDPDFDLVLEVAQGNSVGRASPPHSFMEFRVLQNPDDTETGFAAAYVNRLGIGNDSLVGFARLYRQTTDGLRSAPGSATFIASDSTNFNPGALSYDGLADFARRGADLTGAVESQFATFTGWFKVNGGDGTFRAICGCNGNQYEIRITSANQFQFRGLDSADVLQVAIVTTETFTASADWHSFLFSFDTRTLIVHLAIDDVVLDPTITTFVLDGFIDFSRSNHSIGARQAGAQFWDGCLSTYWFSITDHLNFSDIAVRRAFVSPSGLPLDLGTTGQLPTGIQPICYFPAGDAATNLGSGGNYLNQAGTNPCATTP